MQTKPLGNALGSTSLRGGFFSRFPKVAVLLRLRLVFGVNHIRH